MLRDGITVSYTHLDVYKRQTDGTLNILADYQKRYPEKIRILEKEIPTGSAKKNFMFLTRQADDFPYVMYCDQDDFWRSEKVRVTLKKMKETESGNTAVSYTHLDVYKRQGREDGWKSSYFIQCIPHPTIRTLLRVVRSFCMTVLRCSNGRRKTATATS